MTSRLTRQCAGFAVLFLLGCHHLGCGEREDEWQPLFPDGVPDLVVVFKAGITPQEVIRFEEEELIIGRFEEGFSHRPGVGVVARDEVDGHSAYSLSLDPSATPEEREAIRNGVKSSPYVYRVFENVAPGDIELGEEPSADAAQNEEESPPE